MKIKKKLFILIATVSAIFAHQRPIMASVLHTLSAQTQSDNAQDRLRDGEAAFSQVGRHMQAFNHTNSSSLSNGHSQSKSDLEAQNTHNSQNLVESVAQTQAATKIKKNKKEQYACYYDGLCRKKTCDIKKLWRHWQSEHFYYICPNCRVEFSGTDARKERINHVLENSCIPGVAKEEIANALDDLDDDSDNFYQEIGLNHTNRRNEENARKGSNKKRYISRRIAVSHTDDEEAPENQLNSFDSSIDPAPLSASASRALDIESGIIDPISDFAHFCLLGASTNASTNSGNDGSEQIQMPLDLNAHIALLNSSSTQPLDGGNSSNDWGHVRTNNALSDSTTSEFDVGSSIGHTNALSSLATSGLQAGNSPVFSGQHPEHYQLPRANTDSSTDLAANVSSTQAAPSNDHQTDFSTPKKKHDENQHEKEYDEAAADEADKLLAFQVPKDPTHKSVTSSSTGVAANRSSAQAGPSLNHQIASSLAQAQIALYSAPASKTQNTTSEFSFSTDFMIPEEHDETQNEKEYSDQTAQEAIEQVLAFQLPQNSGYNSVTSPSITGYESANSSSGSSNAAIPCLLLQNAQTPTPQESPSVSDLVNVPLTHNLPPQYATSTTTKKFRHLSKKGLSKGIKTNYKRANLNLVWARKLYADLLFDTNEHSSSSNSSLPSAPLAISVQNTLHNTTDNNTSSLALSALPLPTIAFACPHCTKPFVKRQGLAGHLASCKKKPKKTTPSISNPTSASTAQTSNTIQTNTDLTHTSMASTLVAAAHKKLNSSSPSDEASSNSGSKKTVVKKAAASASSSSSTTPTSRVAAEATPPQTSSQAQKKNDDADLDDAIVAVTTTKAPKTTPQAKKGTKRKDRSNNTTLAASSSHAATSSSSNSSSSSASTASAVGKKVIVKKTPTITASNSSTNKSRGAAELARQKINSQTRKKYNEDADTDSDDSHDENYDANNATSENDDGDGDQARKPQNKKRKVANNSSSSDASSKSRPRLSAAATQIAKKSATLKKQDSQATTTKSEKDQKQNADYICTVCDTRVVNGHIGLYKHKKAAHKECPKCKDFFNDDTYKKHACTQRYQIEFRCYHKDCYQQKKPPIFKQYYLLKTHEEQSHMK